METDLLQFLAQLRLADLRVAENLGEKTRTHGFASVGRDHSYPGRLDVVGSGGCLGCELPQTPTS